MSNAGAASGDGNSAVKTTSDSQTGAKCSRVPIGPGARFTFDLYAASGWDDGEKPRRLSAAGLALVRAVHHVAEGYTHDYVS